MNKDTVIALLAIPLLAALGLGFAFAGSNGQLVRDGFLHPIAAAIGVAYLLQWLAFIPAYLKQTEKHFDLMGSLGYISAVLITLALSRNLDARAWLVAAMVLVWAVRLGAFLVKRIHKAGKDGRFDALKGNPIRFAAAWTLQGLWISFTAVAALTAIAASHRAPFDAYAVGGLLVWLFGFGLEAVADWQKSRFKADSANQGKFIDTGLWSLSRHPNYFGEIVLWTGVAIVSIPTLHGWQWLVLSSPFLVAILLLKVSGIPLLEERSNQKWGGQSDYEAYKRRTPVLVPRVPGRRSGA